MNNTIKADAPVQKQIDGGQIFAVPDVDNGVVKVKLNYMDGGVMQELILPLAPQMAVRLYTHLHQSAAYVRKHEKAKKPQKPK